MFGVIVLVGEYGVGSVIEFEYEIGVDWLLIGVFVDVVGVEEFVWGYGLIFGEVVLCSGVCCQVICCWVSVVWWGWCFCGGLGGGYLLCVILLVC